MTKNIKKYPQNYQKTPKNEFMVASKYGSKTYELRIGDVKIKHLTPFKYLRCVATENGVCFTVTINIMGSETSLQTNN